ncbi:2Fe-2S iron-sulfur cluster-binding protein [Streptomyces sp. NPDC096040]|uniref:2Fe-2S iron-sulfur cluster-binding protein n=1 Tax=Streptomyces sp. NPDC096040 TaxID=3155541 RepID=UPI003324A4BE
MTDEQHGEGAPSGGGGRWDPLPQGDYDDGATAFVKLPEGGIDALLSGDSPLAAPGHGYVPPQIAVAPGTETWGAPADGARWPDPNAVPQERPVDDRFTYNPATTQQWTYEEPPPAPGHDVTGQWSIPVASGDVPDESGEFTTSALMEQWGGTPPTTLPGGASAPWATEVHAWEHPTEAPGAPAGAPAGHGDTPAPGLTAEAAGVAPGVGAIAAGEAGEPGDTGELRVLGESPDAAARRAVGESPDTGAWRPVGEPPETGARRALGRPRAADQPSGTDRSAVVAGPAAVGNEAAVGNAALAGDAALMGNPALSGNAAAALGSPAEVGEADEPHGAPTHHPARRFDPHSAPDPQAADGDALPQGPPAPDDEGRTDGADGQERAEGEAEAIDDHPLASYVLRVNGTDRPVTDAWIGESLLYVLRERLGLAGAKDGCSQGECGACNVQVDGRLVASCLVPAVTAAGSEVRTVEGLAQDGRPSDVQRALALSGAVQCGFCVPGMAMTVHDLLEGNPAPTEMETRQALCGNLCRCSGYRGVLDAVQEVVAEREAHAAADAETDSDEARIPHQAGPGAGGVNASAFDSPGTFASPAQREQSAYDAQREQSYDQTYGGDQTFGDQSQSYGDQPYGSDGGQA